MFVDYWLGGLVAPSDFGSEVFLSEIPSESERLRNSDRNTSENPDSDEKRSSEQFSEFGILQYFNKYSENRVKLDGVGP